MTNQEKLAKLIGEEGFDIASWAIRGKTGYFPEPKPIPELIEIAESRFRRQEALRGVLDIYGTGFQMRWRTIINSTFDVVTHGTTEQEARMACAIEALKRLVEEQKCRRCKGRGYTVQHEYEKDGAEALLKVACECQAMERLKEEKEKACTSD